MICKSLTTLFLLACLPSLAADPAKSVYVVSDYGAIPGDRTGKSLDTAIDKIRAEIADRDANRAQTGSLLGATIRFPASALPWVVGRPHWIDGNSWEVAGDGRNNTTVVARDFHNHPAFIFGWPMRPSARWSKYPGVTLTPDFHPDASGILDASAGTRWGVKLTPEVSASFPASPFSSGPGDGRQYDGLRQHTLELCYAPPDPSKPIPGGYLCGFGDWMISATPAGKGTMLGLFLKLTAADGTPTVSQNFAVYADVAPIYRITVQIDLDAATAQFWVNGVQVARWPKNASLFARGSRPLTYYRNDLYPFSLGFNGPNVDAYGSQLPPIGGTVYGLRMTSQTAYADDGTGSAQRRLDGQPITDFSRYFDERNGCYTYLPLNDPPSDDPASVAEGRLISWVAPGVTQARVEGYGYFVFNSNGVNPGSVSKNVIRDLTIRTSGAPRPIGVNPFGQAVAVGSVFEFHAERLDLTGGAHGLGSINLWPSWKVYFDDLRLAGVDAGLYGYHMLIEGRNFYVSTPIRTGLRFWGSSASLRGVFFSETCALTQANIFIHGDQYGGGYRLEEVMCDTEIGTGPLQGAVVMETHPYTGTRLRITDLDCAQLPASAVPIVLRDCPRIAQSWNPTAIVDGVSVWSSRHRATVARQSRRWAVNVSNSQLLGSDANAAASLPLILDDPAAK